jgi:hypothetical protein
MPKVLELLDEGRATLTDGRRAIDTAERLLRQSRDLALTYRRGNRRLIRGSSDVNEESRPLAWCRICERWTLVYSRSGKPQPR